MMNNRRIERFVGAWLVLIGAVLCFSGNLNHGLGLALLGLIAYLANGELWRRRFTGYVNVKIKKTEAQDD